MKKQRATSGKPYTQLPTQVGKIQLTFAKNLGLTKSTNVDRRRFVDDSHYSQELIVSDGEKREFAATRASPEWFSCFQTFFFKVNRQAGRMGVATDADTATATTAATTAATAAATGAVAASAASAAAGDGAASSENIVTAFPITPSAPVSSAGVVGVDATSGQGEPGRRDAIGGGGGGRAGGAGVEAEGMLAASELVVRPLFQAGVVEEGARRFSDVIRGGRGGGYFLFAT